MPDPKPDPTVTAPPSAPQVTGTDADTLGVAPGEPHALPERIGEYVVLGELGRGGMGVVYRAQDPALRREVALKVMLPESAANLRAKARFVREARAQAKVEHEHVAVIHAVAEYDGIPLIVMPLLKGTTLHAALRANPRPPLAEVVRIGREMAEGLAAAHEQGLVHRDIKPANVWLEGKKLRVRVLDFGLARTADDEETARDTDGPVTREGAVVGTPAYMSPEQGRAMPVDGRTDLWSLGVVLYQMTTGEMPFRGATTLALLTSIALDNPPLPIQKNPSVPPPLSDLVVRLLSKDPAGRPPTAEVVVEELRAIELGLVNAVRVIPLDAAPPVVIGPATSAPDPFADLDLTEASAVPDAEPVGEVDAPARRPASDRGKPGGFPVWAMVAGVLLAVAGVVGFVVSQLGKKPPADGVAKDDAPPAVIPPAPKKDSRPPAGGDADRAAVEAVHANAFVSLTLPSRESRNYAPSDVLPDGPWELFGITPSSAEAVPRDFAAQTLKALAGQKSFVGFHDPYQLTEWTETEFTRLSELPCRTTLTEFRTGLHLTPKTADTLKRFPNLTGLGLLAGAADDAVLGSVKDVLQRQQYLIVRDLGKSGRVTGAGWAAVAGPDCAEMVLVKPIGMDRAACEAIARMPNLSSLTIDGGSIDAGMLDALSKCPKLESLNLTRTVIAPGAGKHFAAFRSLKYLLCNLCGPTLTDDDVPHFASLKTLRALGLNGTGVTEAGGKLLSAALPRCHIDAGGKSFEPTDAHFREANRFLGLSNATVSVKLGDGKVVPATKPADLPDEPFTLTAVYRHGVISDAELKPLTAIPTLESFHAGAGPITAAGLRALLPSKATLTSFYLGNHSVGDEELKLLAEFTGLVRLNTGLNATETGVTRLLKALPKLELLSLLGTGVTDACLVHLATMPKLTTLQLYDTAVSDAGVEALAGVKGLQVLVVIGTRVTAEGYAKLKAALPNCKIEWEDPHRAAAKWLLGKPGATVDVRPTAALGAVVRVKAAGDLPDEPFTLIQVDMHGPLTDADAKRLEAVTTLERVTAGTVTAAGLRSLRPSRAALRHFYTAGSPLDGEALGVLAEFTGLTSLHAEVAATGPEVARLVKALPELASLYLYGRESGDALVPHLAPLSKLRVLYLDSPALTDASIDALGRMTGLKNLGLRGTAVTAAGYEKLKAALPQCNIVWVSPERAVAEWALAQPRHYRLAVELPGGKVLVLEAKEDIPAGPFTVVQIIATGAVFSDADVRRLGGLTKLAVLSIPGNTISDEGVRGLLHLKDSLEGFDPVALTDAGLETIARFTRLKNLSLGPAVTDAGLKHLGALVRLEQLSLADSAVSDAAVETLAGFKTLLSLNLKGTRVTAPGVKKIQSALPKCQVHWEAIKKP